MISYRSGFEWSVRSLNDPIIALNKDAFKSEFLIAPTVAAASLVEIAQVFLRR
jgi:hypothetical protein